jgi:signal transduction histidine kinase
MIKITAAENDGFVTVSIANNGPKIPDEIKEKIFDKFYTTKARKNGSGLGLSIVRSVLEEHNAKITL